jgi:hypothetical protein
MDNKDREEDLITKLKIINKRIDWIASKEGRAALVKGFGANGEFFKEKMALIDRAEEILDQLTEN